MNKKASSNVQRAAEILITLGGAGTAGMSLASLAEATGDAKSAVHRALVSLAEYGLVDQTGRRGNYRLGPAIYALAHRTPSINDLVTVFRPALMSITAETGLSSFLMVRAGLDTVCLDFQTGVITAQSLIQGVGGRLPLGVGLAGVVFLAMMPSEACERALKINEPRYGVWNVDPAVIRAEIAQFRRDGFVYGRRDSMDIANLTLSVPAYSEQLFNCEAAVSVLAPIGGLRDDAASDIARIMRQHLDQPVAQLNGL
ncbi:IclR family transcriptional regulator [Pseudochelatococcus lubricantis]|uniref:IclR family transcriptional regulator n=1 Tax=Pseudochelatococcus lubricantis TaxID=1538102 RepID=UPI0035E55F3A